MAQFIPKDSAFARLKDSVVVISGGATGIGAATVKLLANHGAKIVVGDVNVDAAKELAKAAPNLEIRQCDVSKYDEVYALFRFAYDKYGHVDHAFSCAGVLEQGK
jgi:NAD(P)-dependent dehydrogenase (short-subunit alcohol dehydrogenase family)